MIKVAVPSGSRSKRLKFEEECADSESDDDLLSSDEESDNGAEEEGGDEQQGERISTGESVRVVSGAFLGYFAMVVGESYGEELEIQYFEKKEKWWVLKEYDFDSRPQTDLRRVGKARVDGRMHYFFNEI